MTQDYYSTKRTTCWPADRSDDETGISVSGMAIKYQDGYTSWCPIDVFERDYQPITAMSFGHAIAALKAGDRVCRAGWVGSKGLMFITDAGDAWSDDITDTLPWIGSEVGDGSGKFTRWLVSEPDILADDWMIVGATEESEDGE